MLDEVRVGLKTWRGSHRIRSRGVRAVKGRQGELHRLLRGLYALRAPGLSAIHPYDMNAP